MASKKKGLFMKDGGGKEGTVGSVERVGGVTDKIVNMP
jgi:hypothetical protein